MNNLLNSLNLLCGQFVISLLVFVLWQASHSFPLVSILNPKHHYSVIDNDLPWAHPGFWVGGGTCETKDEVSFSTHPSHPSGLSPFLC